MRAERSGASVPQKSILKEPPLLPTPKLPNKMASTSLPVFACVQIRFNRGLLGAVGSRQRRPYMNPTSMLISVFIWDTLLGLSKEIRDYTMYALHSYFFPY